MLYLLELTQNVNQSVKSVQTNTKVHEKLHKHNFLITKKYTALSIMYDTMIFYDASKNYDISDIYKDHLLTTAVYTLTCAYLNMLIFPSL